MDWGIVGSVIVGLVLFIVGIALVAMLFMGLAIRSMKKKSDKLVSTVESGGSIEDGEVPRCPMPMCPMNKEMEKVISALKGKEQTV